MKKMKKWIRVIMAIVLLICPFINGMTSMAGFNYYESQSNRKKTGQGGNPIGYVDIIRGGEGTVYVAGWAYDPDNPTESIGIHVYIDGVAVIGFTADKERTDVEAANPGVGYYHGFEEKFTVNKVGTFKIEVYAINIGDGSNILLNSEDKDAPRTVTILPTPTPPPTPTPTPDIIVDPAPVVPDEPEIPTAADLVGTAQLDSMANGWCGNEDCTNVKASINGPGTYAVSCNWDEVQDDPQNFCAVRISDLESIADYVTFSDVTVWIDGKVVFVPVIYGVDKDCRIQLWNCWGNDGIGAGFEVPANFPKTFYEIKVQFTIGLSSTARDWDVEGKDPYVISVNTSRANYTPSKQPIVAPTASDLVGIAQLDLQANGWCGNKDCTNIKASINGLGTYAVSCNWDKVQDDPQNYCAVRIPDLDSIADYVTFSDVTIWIDGKVVSMPVIYCDKINGFRLQLWNFWTNDGIGAGCAVPANFPKTFYEIKVQFTIGLRSTPRDWSVEGTDSSLISINTSRSDYTPSKKPASTEDNGSTSSTSPSPSPSTPSPSPVTPKPSTPTPSTPSPQIPTASDLVGTAQLDSQANGWCGNDDCTNAKASISGPGTYVVSSNWDEVQDDPQGYCAVRIPALDSIADYVTFSDVTVWVDGKVRDIPVVYSEEKDCRIQLWNTWANDGVGAGCKTPENLPDTFYEIRVMFTIGLRSTPRDWEKEGYDSSLISVNTSRADYTPQRKPASIQNQPVKKPETVTQKIDSVKASKTKVTVKKGKTVKLKFKITRKNANTGCSVKNNGKYAKIINIKKQGSDTSFSITVSVKGVKKGNTKIVVKLGKKTATVKLKIK